MCPLPATLLSRFYIAHSLCNNASGFELAFKNRLAPSTLVGVGPLTVDSQDYAGDVLTVRLERPPARHGRLPEPLVWAATDVTAQRALPFDLNTIVRVAVTGHRLLPGQHDIALVLRFKEVGDIVVAVVDQLAECAVEEGPFFGGSP